MLLRDVAFYKKQKTVAQLGDTYAWAGGSAPRNPRPLTIKASDMLFIQQINPLSIIYVPVCLSIHVSLPRFYLMSLLSIMHSLLRC
jgi:hypothetical protein